MTPKRLLLVLCLVLAPLGEAAGEILRVEELRETYGRRFCEIAWKTSLACETRLVVSDGAEECVLRPGRPALGLEHHMMVPLGPGRELSYSIVFPDGSRSEPRKLKVAAVTEVPIALGRGVAADGTLEITAGAGMEARWTLVLPGRGEIEAPPVRAASARFRIERLEADAALEGGVVRAAGIDGVSEAPAGPILGNRRLARQFVDAMRQMDVGALLGMAVDKKSDRPKLAEAYREMARRSGLDRVVSEAAVRAAGIASDDAVDSSLTIALTYGLCRLGDVDWAARLRGWEPVTAVEEQAAVLGRPTSERPVPAVAHSLFAQEWTRIAALAPWPNSLAGGPDSCSFARLTDPEKFKNLLEEIQDKLPNAAAFLTAFVQIQLAMWSEMEVPSGLLDSPDGRVTLYVQAALPDPVIVVHLRLNDRVMVALRVTPEDYKASVERQPKGAAALDAKNLNYVWAACATSARFLHEGKNNFVLTLGSASNRLTTMIGGVLREMKIARGGLPR
ncbi:MAG: hypothetical protein HYY25_14005 [Candidatus Wallbacteria bacterium]|nr:hypothetical protein [Candidatus Wallbacteria bacterium]